MDRATNAPCFPLEVFYGFQLWHISQECHSIRLPGGLLESVENDCLKCAAPKPFRL